MLELEQSERHEQNRRINDVNIQMARDTSKNNIKRTRNDTAATYTGIVVVVSALALVAYVAVHLLFLKQYIAAGVVLAGVGVVPAINVAVNALVKRSLSK